MQITLEQFLDLPVEAVHELMYERQLSMSLLLNGTRRVYMTEHFDAPPTDNSYLADCLENILIQMARILKMLAEHGIYRVFLPAYSQFQDERDPEARKYLIKGLQSLVYYPALQDAYTNANYSVHFYGDTRNLPSDVTGLVLDPPDFTATPRHHVYYGIEGGNIQQGYAHNYILELAFQFGMEHGRAPSWEEMLELYYGDRTLKPLDILVAFNRIYDRVGIPPLLNGRDRIYATVVSPINLTETQLRRILYDFAFTNQDTGRDYMHIHPDEFQRLKAFYAANAETVIGLNHKFEDLCYPLPSVVWPEEMYLQRVTE